MCVLIQSDKIRGKLTKYKEKSKNNAYKNHAQKFV